MFFIISFQAHNPVTKVPPTIKEISESSNIQGLAPSNKKTEEVDAEVVNNDDGEEEDDYINPFMLNDIESESITNEGNKSSKVSVEKEVKSVVKSEDVVKSSSSTITNTTILESELKSNNNDNNLKIKKRKLVEEEEVIEEVVNSSDVKSSVFDIPGLLSNTDWDPTTDSNNKEIPLPNFGFDSTDYQTLGIKLSVPTKSQRWSINISPLNHCKLSNIFLHFNPRAGVKKPQLIINDKIGTWGPLMRLPL